MAEQSLPRQSVTTETLDGATFSVIVSRRPDDRWLVRVFGPRQDIIAEHTGGTYADGLYLVAGEIAKWVGTHGGGPR